MRMKPAAFNLARGSWAEAMTLNSSSVSGGTCCLGPMWTSFKIASRSMNTALFIVAKKQIPGLTPRIEQKSSSSLKNNAFQHEFGSQLCEKTRRYSGEASLHAGRAAVAEKICSVQAVALAKIAKTMGWNWKTNGRARTTTTRL